MQPLRVPAQRDDLIEDEEVLEGVREYEEEGPDAAELEQHGANEAEIQQETGGVDRFKIRPIPHRREVGDGQVIDVERLVVALVVGQVEIREP